MTSAGAPGKPGRRPEGFPELDRSRVRWDTQTGQLKQAVGPLTDESDDPPDAIAQRFLTRYASVLGAEGGGMLEHLKLAQVTRDPAGHVVRYQQVAGEVPVYRAGVSIYVNPRGQVYRISNDFRPTATRAEAMAGVSSGLDAQAARRIAQTELAGEGRLREPAQAEMVIYPLGNEARPAWRVTLALEKPTQLWSVLVDAQSGKVLERTPTLAQSKR